MREQLEEIILSSYEAMYRTAFVYLRQEEDAMDAVQEAIVKALKQVDSVREPEYLKTWLFRILINTALDEQKRKKKILPLLNEEEVSREDVYRDLDVLNVLNSLEETERIVVSLRYFEDWKIEDIAWYLKKNVNTVKSILYRSLKKLKTELVKEEPANEG